MLMSVPSSWYTLGNWWDGHWKQIRVVEGRRRGRGSDRACLGQARVIRRGKGVGDKGDREQRYRQEGLQDTWQGGGWNMWRWLDYRRDEGCGQTERKEIVFGSEGTLYLLSSHYKDILREWLTWQGLFERWVGGAGSGGVSCILYPILYAILYTVVYTRYCERRRVRLVIGWQRFSLYSPVNTTDNQGRNFT